MDSDEELEEDKGLENLEQQDRKDESRTTNGSAFWADWKAGRRAGNKTTAWTKHKLVAAMLYLPTIVLL
jgi:hypothetical protein